ncbi:ABC transporter ATP-binding protein [Granulicoccus phenolivorans]|uniref:ABC transporter ATP-binding protein n=1 Tax=Granulicoccus phenolivorans TaxID=266854 RepID=UPI00040CB671|nr:ABC transporter ATP-binding protein [Granulicoccus phenolivorans]
MSRTEQAPERPKNAPTGPQHGPMAQRVNERAINFGPSLKRLVRRMRPEAAVLTGVIVLGVIGVALMVLGPKVLGWATDVVFTGVMGMLLPQLAPGLSKDQAVELFRANGQGGFADMLARLDVVPGQGIDFDQLGRILLLALALYLVSGIFSFVQGWVLNGAIQRTIYRMRADLQAKLSRLPLSYFDKQPRGELLSRATNDIDNVSQTMQQTLSQMLNALLQVIGVLIMMFWISPTLALVALIVVPAAMGISVLIGRKAQIHFKRTWAATGELNAHVEEAYTGHSLVKVFGHTKEAERVFAERNEQLYHASFMSQFISGIMMPANMFLGNVSYVVIAVLGGLRVASGTMSLGDVQAFIQYSRQFTQPLTQLASMANLLQSGVASAERVFAVMDAPEQSPEADGQLQVVRGETRFEHVSFSYSPDEPLIEDLSLVVRPGQTVAIVGPTGAGKTTLVNLLMRFYELDAGRITLDGTDIATVPRADLRRRIGMVLQDTWLFHGTIEENLAYGRLDATGEEVRAAAEATYVDRFVHSLPDGYDTVIDEEASNLSAGEKQLLTIARAFLANAPLLILDEATSSVDTRTEVAVQQAMNALRKDRTSFVIAHRLSTIRDADLILVMEAGRIVEQGNHDELLAADGAYRRLYLSQFSGPVDAEV